MAQIKAIIFDQDGVIIDTERDGHRVSFNKTLKEFGFDFEWGVQKYHELLQIAGGKERMKHHLQTDGFGKPVRPEDVDDLIAKMHKRKTAMFVEMIEAGELPLRPGVRRFMLEIMAAGLRAGICTTSNEQAAHAIAYKILKDIQFDFVLAGDIVKKKKPDPEIYHLATEKTGLKANECLVVEDSRNGVLAAKAAGMFVLATTNIYTEKEDLHEADIIVTSLGDPGVEKGVLKYSSKPFKFDGIVHVPQLLEYFSS